MGDDGRTRVEQLMMAPNPHWWAEDAEVYYNKQPSFLSTFHILALIIGWKVTYLLTLLYLPGVGPAVLLIGGLGLVAMMFFLGLRIEPTNSHLETRHTFLTEFKKDEVLVHESMRDLVSIEPINHLKNGKLKYHDVAFWNGCKIKIYPSLERHDELIAKLNGYLSANCQQQTVDG